MVILSESTYRRLSKICQSDYKLSKRSNSPGSKPFYPSRPHSLALYAPKMRAHRLSKKFFNLNVWWSGAVYQRLQRWEQSFVLTHNPAYLGDAWDADWLDDSRLGLTTSMSTDSGYGLELDDFLSPGKILQYSFFERVLKWY